MKAAKQKQLWTGPECLVCLSTIAYDVLQRATKDPAIQLKGMKKTYELLTGFTLQQLPTDIANKIYQMIQNLTNNADPFKEIKIVSKILAQEAIERIRPHIMKENQPYKRFRKTLAAAITGNVIDFGTAGHSIQMNSEYLEHLYYQINEEGFAIDHSAQLFEAVSSELEILFLADNAGEIFFDTFLLDQIQIRGSNVILVVKGGAISNDATLEDVDDPIFKKVASKIITTGSNALGVSLTESSQEFLELLQNVDLIIAKGQSNFETVYYYHEKLTSKPVYFLFRTKCNRIAQFLGQSIGKNVVFGKNI
ncbi:MAG: damage-control phosphatase ARMT1 family protein [Candidatus Helarchaeota archaeon]